MLFKRLKEENKLKKKLIASAISEITPSYIDLAEARFKLVVAHDEFRSEGSGLKELANYIKHMKKYIGMLESRIVQIEDIISDVNSPTYIKNYQEFQTLILNCKKY